MDHVGRAELAEAEAEVEGCPRHDNEIGISKRRRPGAREGQLVVGWDRAPTETVDDHRDARSLHKRPHRVLGVTPIDVGADNEHRTLGPRNTTGDGHQGVRIRRLAGDGRAEVRRFRTELEEHVKRHVDEGWAAMRRGRGRQRCGDRRSDRRDLGRGRRRLGDRGQDGQRIELLERPDTPARRGRAAADHQDRRAVE